jgi:CheY-like chemotaxis protein
MNSTLNLLTAEDNEDDLFLLQEAFKKTGTTSRLFTVRDGVEAVAYLKGEEAYGDRTEYPFPDVLLLDLNMPRMNGFEVLEWLRQDPQCSRLVVHVLTASAREADVERAYALRANSFVVKPSRFNDLVAFIAALHQWHHFTSFPRRPSASPTLAQTHDLR